MSQADVDRLKAEIEQLKGELEALAREGVDDVKRAAKKGARRAKAAFESVADDLDDDGDLRSRAQAGLADLRVQAEGLEEQLIDKVRAKPLQSLAIAAGIGFLFALVSSR